MVKQEVVVKNQTGLHLRPAGVLCKVAMRYKSKILFYLQGTEANVKSILSVLSACVKEGDTIEFCCEGEDEEEALQEMIRIVENGLGENT